MCGVVGIVSKEDAAPALYEALTVIQHRGQDSCGIAYTDIKDINKIIHQKTSGLVKDFIDKCKLESSYGFLGHTRYTTSGQRTAKSEDKMIHPIVGNFKKSTFVFVFNGNIPNIDN